MDDVDEVTSHGVMEQIVEDMVRWCRYQVMLLVFGVIEELAKLLVQDGPRDQHPTLKAISHAPREQQFKKQPFVSQDIARCGRPSILHTSSCSI
jgi:hypothetical protein